MVQTYQALNYQFDATAHDPDAGNEPIPAGTYIVGISGVTIRDNKEASSGQHLMVEFSVLDGEFKNRKVSNNYNLWHKENAQTVEIAHKQLSALCFVTGQFRLDFNNGGRELLSKQLRLRVDNDGRYNSIKEVFDINGNKPNKAGTGAPAPATAPVAMAAPTAPVAPAAPAQPAAWGNAPAAVAPVQPVAQPQPGFAPQPAYAPAPVAAPAAAYPPAQPTQPAAAPAAPAAWNQAPAVAPAGAPAPWGPPAAA